MSRPALLFIAQRRCRTRFRETTYSGIRIFGLITNEFTAAMRLMHLLKAAITTTAIMSIATGCESAPEVTRFGFVTRLGNDTLAVESFRQTANGTEADVVLRTPQTSIRHYVLETDDQGGLTRFEAEERLPGGDVWRREVVMPRGDSLEVTVTEDGQSETNVVSGGRDALPFIDMVHWPFEQMLMRARAADADSVTQELFTTRGSMGFAVEKISEDSMTVTHPFRGTMMVDVDAEGRLIHLDASRTTRKLTVDRVAGIDVASVARRFAAQDSAGRTFGPLSGRGEAMAEIDDASIRVDYGQPSKRGRVIWGELIPWGELWRTGANRATHFETDRALNLSGLNVPPGTYTLYSIPEEDGGTLIVNRQTDQGGTTYNHDMDLGRVMMQRSSLPETVEDFTISIEDTDSGGVLSLDWDRSRFYVSFTVDNQVR